MAHKQDRAQEPLASEVLARALKGLAQLIAVFGTFLLFPLLAESMTLEARWGFLFKCWVFAGLLYFPGADTIALAVEIARALREDKCEAAERAARKAAAEQRAREAENERALARVRQEVRACAARSWRE